MKKLKIDKSQYLTTILVNTNMFYALWILSEDFVLGKFSLTIYLHLVIFLAVFQPIYSVWSVRTIIAMKKTREEMDKHFQIITDIIEHHEKKMKKLEIEMEGSNDAPVKQIH